MKPIVTERYCRISKRAAKQRYLNNQPIYFLPCKLHPDNMFVSPYLISRYGIPWETLIAQFAYYNCDNERGRYISFYIDNTGTKK